MELFSGKIIIIPTTIKVVTTVKVGLRARVLRKERKSGHGLPPRTAGHHIRSAYHIRSAFPVLVCITTRFVTTVKLVNWVLETYNVDTHTHPNLR